jgi:colanic acid/amylovoran biosynthesis protein
VNLLNTEAKKKIVISGVTGCRNRGVEALVSSLLSGCEAMSVDTDISVLTTDKPYDSMVHGTRAVFTSDSASSFTGGLKNGLARNLSKVSPRFDRGYQEVASTLDSADVVLATGGDIFSSDYGVGFLRRNLGVLKLAQSKGLATAMVAHSIGPFKSSEEVSMWREVAEKLSFITVREQKSFDYVTDVVRIPRSKVVLTADPAFLLQPAPDAEIDAMWSSFDFDPSKPVVAIAPSQGISNFVGVDSSGDDAHDTAWVNLIRYLTAGLGAQVLIVPHVQDNRISNDDRVITTRLLQRLGYPKNVKAAFGELRAGEFKGLIARSDLLIGERMHACVAGLSTGVPVLSIGYSIKSEGIMGGVLGSDVLKRGLVVPVGEFVGTTDFEAFVAPVWNSRQELKDQIRQALPQTVSAASLNFEVIRQAM